MKRPFVLLIGLMLVAGLVGAQEAAEAESESGSTYEVAFYDGDPAGSGEEIATEEVTANSVAARDEDLEDAEYVTIGYAGQRYTFEVATAGASRNSTILDLTGNDLSVNELLAKQNTDPNALERYSD